MLKDEILLLAIVAISQQPKLSQADAFSGMNTPEGDWVGANCHLPSRFHL